MSRTGHPPLNNSNSITNLLQLNESLNGFRPTIVNPLVPYLFFLPETCADIAQDLPVKPQPGIGLYIWNTDDAQYQRVVQSPTYLVLVFQSTSGNLTIKIPFQLLNLSLEPPIVSPQQQYFPCQPFQASDGTGNYYLGRAFLQAAFLSINWDSGNFFLAQVPEPAAAEPNPISDFLTTWNKTWTPLASRSQSANTDNSAKPPGNNTSKAFPLKRGGLSDRARAGIGVGVTVGVLALAAAAIATWPLHRRRGRPVEASASHVESRIAIGAKDLDEKEAGTVYKEASGEGLPHKAPTDPGVHVDIYIQYIELNNVLHLQKFLSSSRSS